MYYKLDSNDKLKEVKSTNSLSAAPLNVIPFSCISMGSQECKVKPKIVNVNKDDPVFVPFSIKTSKCSGSCNNMKIVSVNVDLIVVFVIINNAGMMINAGLNVKN